MQDNTMRLRDGRSLGFSEYGRSDGIPLLLFHGTPGSRMFSRFENAPWIEKFGLRVIAPERPGYGLSDPQPGRQIKDWAADIEELADYLGLSRFHVAGGSGGAPYALACALHSPARVISATLFSGGVPPEVLRLSSDMQSGNRFVFFLAKYAPFLLKYLLAMAVNSAQKHLDKHAAKILSKFPEWDRRIIESQNGKGIKEGLATTLREAYRQGVEGAYRDMLLLSRPWGLALDEIAVPVFMWHGTADTLMPVSCAREFSKLIPGCETYFIPDVGHQLLGSEEICSQMIARMLSVVQPNCTQVTGV